MKLGDCCWLQVPTYGWMDGLMAYEMAFCDPGSLAGPGDALVTMVVVYGLAAWSQVWLGWVWLGVVPWLYTGGRRTEDRDISKA